MFVRKSTPGIQGTATVLPLQSDPDDFDDGRRYLWVLEAVNFEHFDLKVHVSGQRRVIESQARLWLAEAQVFADPNRVAFAIFKQLISKLDVWMTAETLTLHRL